MKVIRIRSDWFELVLGESRLKFAAGQDLPSDNAEALRQVELLNADVVDVEDPPPAAEGADAEQGAAPDAAAANGDAVVAAPAAAKKAAAKKA